MTPLLLLFALAAFAEDDRHIIVLKKDALFADAKLSLEKLGVQIVRESPGGSIEFLAGVFKSELLGEIQHLSFVEYVEEDARRYPSPMRRNHKDGKFVHHRRHSHSLNSTAAGDPLDTTEVVPYGIAYVQADEHEPTSAIDQVPVCIIDSGLDVNHVEFQALNSAGLIDGYPTDYTTDKCSHGTHVAGTIAASRNGAGVIGTIDRNTLPLKIVKVFGDSCAWTYASDLADAGKQCVIRGAKVVSMSLGGSRSVLLEKTWFDNEYALGKVLFVAAAGNAGTTAYSYPASYDSVVSVAAVDENLNKASFSQYNNQVELSAPGVAVLSSVNTGDGEFVNFWFGNPANTVQAYATSGDSPQYESPKATVNAPTCDCGFGTAPCTGCQDKICLISRGTVSFAEKVLACQAGNGVGTVIYNNAPGTIVATLGSTVTTIPSVTITQADGLAALNAVGQTAYLAVAQSNWEYYDGTSMATPHVSGVAAIVWSYNPKCSNANLRSVLQHTAQRLPTAASPKNNDFGYGMVLTTPAITALASMAC